MIEHKTLDAFTADFDPSVHDAIRSLVARDGVEAVVMFENVDLWSSQVGKRTACIVGPGLGIPSLAACDGRWLGATPSVRQYARSFYRKGA